jgi:hypothetical protein
VAADGLHSVARAAVAGADGVTSAYTGFSAFRFLIPSDMVKGNPEFDEVLSWKSDGLSVLLDTRDKINERHMAWYECQGYVCLSHPYKTDTDSSVSGEVQNLVGIHPSANTVKSEDIEGAAFEPVFI